MFEVFFRQAENAAELEDLITAFAEADNDTKFFPVYAPLKVPLDVTVIRDGERVPVSSINIGFRDMDDMYTDRGIVWVQPGTPAVALFALTRRVLDTSGLVAELAEAALRAVDENVFKHFTQPVH